MIAFRPNRVGALRDLIARVESPQFEMIGEWLDVIGEEKAEAWLVAATAGFERTHPTRFSLEPFVSRGAVASFAGHITEDEWVLVIPAMIAFGWMNGWDRIPGRDEREANRALDRQQLVMTSALSALRGFAEGLGVLPEARVAALGSELLAIVDGVDSASGAALFGATLSALKSFSERVLRDGDARISKIGSMLAERYIPAIELSSPRNAPA